MFNIVVFGPPGCGKGTQSKNIAKEYGWAHISTGDILRKNLCDETSEGLCAAEYMAKGQLVPDSMMVKMLACEIENSKESGGMILDGFPRTLYQARFLDKLFYKMGISVDLVLAIEVSNEEIFKRILGRSKHSGRSDDKEEIIAERLRVYKEKTYPVMQYYLNQEKFTMVSGMAEEEDVFGRLKRTIHIFKDILPNTTIL